MKGLIRHNVLIVAALIKDECCQKNKALTSLPHFHHHGFRVLVPHRNVLGVRSSAWNYTGQFCDNSSSSRAIRSDSQQCHTITDINSRTKPNQDRQLQAEQCKNGRTCQSEVCDFKPGTEDHRTYWPPLYCPLGH
ncbi:unnamed protein product [Prunus armeniaca]